jgi:nucleotide-binding universal stress UspA family protein
MPLTWEVPMSTTLFPRLAPNETQGTAPMVATGPYLVATDGTYRADGALRAAELLGTRYGAATTVVSVLEPFPIVAPDVQFPLTPEVHAERHADRLSAVREQLLRMTGDERTWPVELRQGSPPVEINNKASATNAKLLIVGLGRHNVVDRLFGDETALQLLRTASIPVLAVPSRMGYLPKRGIVAMDFSVSAIRAAQLSLEMLEPNGVLYLVHVIPHDLETAVWESMHEEYGKSVQSAFDQVSRQLSARSSITIETITLHGDPATEVLQWATRVGADLIAAGSHGYGFFSRLLLGSVASKLLRGATCAVLGVPLASVPMAVRDAAPCGEQVADSIDDTELAEMPAGAPG